MPISDARENFAEVVNRAVYGGQPTYITRRGRRLALVVSAAQLEADRARAKQDAIVGMSRSLWAGFASEGEADRDRLRKVIDTAISASEDVGDLAALRAAIDEWQSGNESEPWEQVKAELGL